MAFIELIRQFASDRRAGIFVFVAAALLPLLTVSGGAIDMARLIYARTHLQDSLDAATLAAARARDGGASEIQVQQEGERFFEANCRMDDICDGVSGLDFALGDASVVGTVDSEFPMYFLDLIGISARSVTVDNEAVISPATFENFYFLIDKSASMGIAATVADRQALAALTLPYVIQYKLDNGQPTAGALGCEFACHHPHSPVGDGSHGYDNTYDLARANGIKLMEDVVLEDITIAANALLNSVADHKSDRVRVSAYAFDSELELVQAPTTDIDDLEDSLAEDTTLVQKSTRYDIAFDDLLDDIGAQGTGASEFDPRKTIILLTDGVHDTFPQSPRLVAPILQDSCNEVKDAGFRLVILNIEYPVVAGNNAFNVYVAPFYDDLSTEIANCASPGFYYSAFDADEIGPAMGELINDILRANIRLSE